MKASFEFCSFQWFSLLDDLIVGCGERAISVFNHLTGDLHVHFEIDVPTIGRNIACYTCDVEVSKHPITKEFSFRIFSCNYEQI